MSGTYVCRFFAANIFRTSMLHVIDIIKFDSSVEALKPSSVFNRMPYLNMGKFSLMYHWRESQLQPGWFGSGSEPPQGRSRIVSTRA
jgi:hypothetical protein